MDVFISYKSEEKGIALQLKELLLANGVTCWMAPESIPASSDYATEIGTAINQCKLILLVLSEKSQVSLWVPKEISYGLSRNKTIIPFHIDQSELIQPFDFHLTNVERIEAYERLEVAFQELIEQIQILLRLPTLVSQITKPALRSTSLVKQQDLIGREKELLLLQEMLEENRIVFISGVGGTGKTELVNLYISGHYNEYKTIIVAKYESTLVDLLASEKNFSIENFERNQAETDYDYAIRKLAKIKSIAGNDTLIVIDNFDTIEDELMYELMQGDYRLVFTTRTNFDYLGVSTIALAELDYESQIMLFKKSYRLPLHENDLPLLDELLELIQGHTLTIELIARLMATKHLKLHAMIQQLKNVGISPNLSGAVHHKTSKARSVYAHIESIFDLDALSGDELSVMRNLSLMPLAGVAFEQFMTWCRYDSGEVISNLIERSWIKHNVEQDMISLHPVIADIVRNKTENPVTSCAVMLRSISESFRRTWDVDFNSRLEYLQIANTLMSVLKEQSLSFLWYQALHCVFVNLNMNDASIKTIQLMKKEITESVSLERGWLEYHIADFCLNRLYYWEALEHMQASIACLEQVCPQSFDIAYMKKHIVHIYHAMFKRIAPKVEYLDTALQFLKESELAFESSKLSGDDSLGSIYYSDGIQDQEHEKQSQAASVLYAYGLNYYYREEYESAIDYCMKSYQLFLSINGESNTNTHSPMQVLAQAYSKIGKLDAAVALLQRVISDREVLWGKDHYRYCSIVEILADIYYENGKSNESLSLLNSILEYLANRKDFYNVFIERIQAKIRQYQLSDRQ